ncbi:MAG: hypothetical protein GX879_03640, partial [Bacteroidales bacterium]|nr:hypothetical protein [Bacteroidales bacterium]
MRYIIPNLITSFNLIFGISAILLAFYGQYEASFLCIIFAAICDFSDGFAARLLKAYSDFGKQLDSLSDLISFGLAPAVLIFCYLKNNPYTGLPDWMIYNAFSFTLFAAYRLARFNTLPSSSEFKGLAVPAAALYFASLIVYGNYFENTIFANILSAPSI